MHDYNTREPWCIFQLVHAILTTFTTKLIDDADCAVPFRKRISLTLIWNANCMNLVTLQISMAIRNFAPDTSIKEKVLRELYIETYNHVNIFYQWALWDGLNLRWMRGPGKNGTGTISWMFSGRPHPSWHVTLNTVKRFWETASVATCLDQAD